MRPLIAELSSQTQDAAISQERPLEERRPYWVPSSVYRLQFNRQFTFKDAVGVLPYLKELGVEAVFSSPYFKSFPGSTHGYNITDPRKINPEIGSEEDFRLFCRALKEAELMQIIDVVPNHMGIEGEGNRLWMDVLENGRASPYGHFFDIDWEPLKKELKNKVLLPILGDYYGRVLENQELKLRFDRGEFYVQYYGHKLPVSPDTYPLVLGHRQAELSARFKESDKNYMEYLSIVQAFKNLPSASVSDPEKIRERRREKEVAKERLRRLCSEDPFFTPFIEENVLCFNGVKGNPSSFDLLDDLLDRQSYRVAFWRVASEEINYRRFFDINSLAAIRSELPDVFEFCHELVFDLIRQGHVQGLRIDHPDGLHSPAEYFRRIQKKFKLEVWPELSRTTAGGRSEPALYVVVEKILDRKESLPENWAVYGTVGYDYLNVLNGLFIQSSSEKQFDALYQNFIGHGMDFEDLVYQKKRFFAQAHMASEINTLGYRLNQISERDRHYRDLTLYNLTQAIREVIACFPVYRTYISASDSHVSERDAKYIRIAVEKAKGRNSSLSTEAFDFLKNILLLNFESEAGPGDKALIREFILRFQQLTAPVMAKGIEDTAFYVDNRFVSLNEVGGDPDHFGRSIPDFHQHNLESLRKWPYTFIATSTHDSKRNEDAKARLNVLSEIPEEWKMEVEKWARLNEKYKTLLRNDLEPRRNTEYFIYQLLLGLWPDEELDEKNYESFVERLWQILLKSIRECKIYTNWTNPNPEYEGAARKFLLQVLNREDNPAFWESFIPFQKKLSRFGKLNSLSALVLKAGSPGVVDTYQGNEIWHYTFVDPDNRAPVDYRKRQNLLNDVISNLDNHGIFEDMVRSVDDGRLKLFVLWRLLNFRKKYKDLLLDGEYVPIKAQGEREDHLISFARIQGGQTAIFTATRFLTGLLPEGKFQVPAQTWAGTRVLLPRTEGNLKDLFTGRLLTPGEDGTVSASDLLGPFDFSVIHSV